MLLEKMDTSPTEFSVPRPVFDAFENLRAALAAEAYRVSVPMELLHSALNYIQHCGASQVLKGLPHPQRHIVEGLQSALAAAEKEPRDGS